MNMRAKYEADMAVVLLTQVGKVGVHVLADEPLGVDGLTDLIDTLEIQLAAAKRAAANALRDLKRQLDETPGRVASVGEILRKVKAFRDGKGAATGPDIHVEGRYEGPDGEVREVLNLIESEAGDGPTVHQVRYEILACRQPYRVGERRLVGLEEFVWWMGPVAETDELDLADEVCRWTGDEVVGDGVDPVEEVKGETVSFVKTASVGKTEDPLMCAHCQEPVTGTVSGVDQAGTHSECVGRYLAEKPVPEPDDDRVYVEVIPLEVGGVYQAPGEVVRIESTTDDGAFRYTVLEETIVHGGVGKMFSGNAIGREYLKRIEAPLEPESQDAGDTVSMGQDEAAEGEPSSNPPDADHTPEDNGAPESEGLTLEDIVKGARYTDGEVVREVLKVSNCRHGLYVKYAEVAPSGKVDLSTTKSIPADDFVDWVSERVPEEKPEAAPKAKAAAQVVSKKAEKVNTSPERVKKPAKSEHEPKPSAPLREPDGEPAVPESPPAPYPPAETVLSVDQVREECPYLTRDGETVTVIQRRCGCVGMEVKVEDADGEMIWMSLSRFVTDHRLVPGCFYPVST